MVMIAQIVRIREFRFRKVVELDQAGPYPARR
jgi:hypothetical protein